MDDVLELSHSYEIIIKYSVFSFDIKDNKYGPPTDYLGADVELFQMSDRKYSLIINCDCYVVASMKIIKDLLSEDYIELKSVKSLHKGPLPHGYKNEL